jgi:hypothetical protein
LANSHRGSKRTAEKAEHEAADPATPTKKRTKKKPAASQESPP